MQSKKQSGLFDVDAAIRTALWKKTKPQLRTMLREIETAKADELPPVMWIARSFFALKIDSELRFRDRRRKFNYAICTPSEKN